MLGYSSTRVNVQVTLAYSRFGEGGFLNQMNTTGRVFSESAVLFAHAARCVSSDYFVFQRSNGCSITEKTKEGSPVEDPINQAVVAPDCWTQGKKKG